jgi:hypothetical protein
MEAYIEKLVVWSGQCKQAIDSLAAEVKGKTNANAS